MKKAFFAWIMLLGAVTLKAANPVKLTNEGWTSKF